MATDLDKNLNEIEGESWPDPDYDSYLVKECHRLRTVPLRDFTVEDLRIMIGQDVGLGFLIPLAPQRLESDPLVEGDYYPGDLLSSVLSIPADFWSEHSALHRKMGAIVEAAIARISSFKDTDVTIQLLRRELEVFR